MVLIAGTSDPRGEVGEVMYLDGDSFVVVCSISLGLVIKSEAEELLDSRGKGMAAVGLRATGSLS